METPADDVKRAELKIVVTFNPLTAEFALSGCDANPIVALGMLDYALARIRRSLTTADIQREMQTSPLVSLSSRVVS